MAESARSSWPARGAVEALENLKKMRVGASHSESRIRDDDPALLTI